MKTQQAVVWQASRSSGFELEVQVAAFSDLGLLSACIGRKWRLSVKADVSGKDESSQLQHKHVALKYYFTGVRIDALVDVHPEKKLAVLHIYFRMGCIPTKGF